MKGRRLGDSGVELVGRLCLKSSSRFGRTGEAARDGRWSGETR